MQEGLLIRGHRLGIGRCKPHSQNTCLRPQRRAFSDLWPQIRDRARGLNLTPSPHPPYFRSRMRISCEKYHFRWFCSVLSIANEALSLKGLNRWQRVPRFHIFWKFCFQWKRPGSGGHRSYGMAYGPSPWCFTGQEGPVAIRPIFQKVGSDSIFLEGPGKSETWAV